MHYVDLAVFTNECVSSNVMWTAISMQINK